MQDLINLLFNNGIGVVCVAYLIYFQQTTLKDLTKNQEKTNSILDNISIRLENIERKEEKYEIK